MKIAYLSYDFPEYCLRHANAMPENADVMLMLPDQSSREYRHLLNGKQRLETFSKPRLRQPIRQSITAMQIVRKVHRFKPDVVHIQNGHMYFNFATPLLKRYPIVTTIHDARQHPGDAESGNTPQWIMDFGFKKSDQIIVHGKGMVDIVVSELGFDPLQVHVIPHVSIGEVSATCRISDEEEKILFFGRIWEYKGLEYLIRAQPRVTAKFPNAKIVIGGKGEDLQRYRQMMIHPDRFEVHNDWISDDEREKMFASSSIVVLPYIEASQSGVVPLAYMYEKPVIVTDVGGLPDTVDHGLTGLLVEPRDADGLADAIIELLSDKARRVQMGQMGKKKLLAECSPSTVAMQTFSVYKKAVACHAKKRQAAK